MLKVLLWVVSNDKQFIHDAITTTLRYQYDAIKLFGPISKNQIIKVDCAIADIILVVGAKKFGMNQIIKEVRRYNLPEEKFLGDWIVATSGFSLEKYRRLQASHLSIFSINCFAGVISHTLSLPFCSPTINLFFNTQDYLKFLHAPQVGAKKFPAQL